MIITTFYVMKEKKNKIEFFRFSFKWTLHLIGSIDFEI
jgi:hypothetical protein